MAEIKANGNEMIECGNSMIALCDDYIAQINILFDSLSKLNKGAWEGKSAQVYDAKLVVDKKKFVDFGDYLKMYGKVIKNTGDNITNNINCNILFLLIILR